MFLFLFFIPLACLSIVVITWECSTFQFVIFFSFWLLIVHKDQDPPNRVICPEAAIKYFFMFSYLGESALENSDYAKISSYLRLWLSLLLWMPDVAILHASLEHKLHKKDKVEEIVGRIEICQGTNKAGIDFSLSSNWCPSSLQRKTTPPSPSREAQKTQQLSSRCSPILVSNSQLPQLRMGSGRLTLCWCLR